MITRADTVGTKTLSSPRKLENQIRLRALVEARAGESPSSARRIPAWSRRGFELRISSTLATRNARNLSAVASFFDSSTFRALLRRQPAWSH